ncbi:MAG: hypothetical protein WBD40_09680 [Tepidisphaeraceae bacterium]
MIDLTAGLYPDAKRWQIQDERLGDFLPGELDALLAEGEKDIEQGATVTLAEAREHFQRRKDQTAGK